MKLGIIGKGRMGKAIDAIIDETPHDIVFRCDEFEPLTADLAKTCDAMIDFSTANCLQENLDIALATQKPLIVGTTGWYERVGEIKTQVDEGNGSFLFAANFSIGVALFRMLTQEAGRLVAAFPEYDVAVHETHHTGKIDSPSGTGIMLGEVLLSQLPHKKKVLAGNPEAKLPEDALQVSSSRLGSVPGTHHVMIDSVEDSIELTHTARGRMGFARGAIRAAAWLSGKQGFFTLDDMLSDMLKSQR